MSESTSATARPPVPGFQSAATVPRPSTHVPSTSSHRNAINILPPVPAPAPAPAPSSENGNGDGDTNAVAGPSKPVQRPVTRKNAIIYNAVQRRNPVLTAIKSVAIEIGDIVADFQVGTHNGVLFLSLKYHRLHPEYIHQRIEKMKNQYNLRVLLVLCDINEHQQTLREISKIAIVNDFSTFVAWTSEEVAQYLVSFKQLETTSANSLKERIHQTYSNQLQHVLTSTGKVNKTDAINLASQFGSFHNIVKQPSKVLSGVKGLGATKVNVLLEAFNKPFIVKHKGADATKPGRPAMDITATKDTGQADDDGGVLQPGEGAPIPDWPEPEPEAEEDAWRDPLEDDDEEEEEGEPSAKRSKV